MEGKTRTSCGNGELVGIQRDSEHEGVLNVHHGAAGWLETEQLGK